MIGRKAGVVHQAQNCPGCSRRRTLQHARCGRCARVLMSVRSVTRSVCAGDGSHRSRVIPA